MCFDNDNKCLRLYMYQTKLHGICIYRYYQQVSRPIILNTGFCSSLVRSYGRRAFSVASPAIWTGYQTVWETRPSAETPSDVHWRCFYFQLTCVHSALELSGCALQIYLLTYFANSLFKFCIVFCGLQFSRL